LPKSRATLVITHSARVDRGYRRCECSHRDELNGRVFQAANSKGYRVQRRRSFYCLCCGYHAALSYHKIRGYLGVPRINSIIISILSPILKQSKNLLSSSIFSPLPIAPSDFQSRTCFLVFMAFEVAVSLRRVSYQSLKTSLFNVAASSKSNFHTDLANIRQSSALARGFQIQERGPKLKGCTAS
jgi:hypothetical protein